MHRGRAVTVCAVFQFVVPYVNAPGDTVTAASPLVTLTVTGPLGSVANATVYVPLPAVASSSVNVSVVGSTASPVSSSTVVTLTVRAASPL